MLVIIAIQTDTGYLVSDKTAISYDSHSLATKLFDGVAPTSTFHNDWNFISQYPQKVSHMEKQPNINYRFILKDDSFSGKIPLELKREDAGEMDCNNEVIWKPEIAMYRSLYVEVSDAQPDKEVTEEFTFEVIFKVDKITTPAEFKYPSNERYVSYTNDKVTDYISNQNVTHQILDKIIFPEILLHETPSQLSSKQTYDIVRQHVKRNINPKVAHITSDYDFCFEVAKIIPLSEPFTQRYERTYGSRGNRRKPLVENRLIATREVKVFEMTNGESAYKGYTIIQGFEAKNETELKTQIDNYLNDLMAFINEPFIDCPKCKGRGVLFSSEVEPVNTKH